MTFTTLRALQAIIGDALDEIYAAYKSQHSPNLSPSSSSSSLSSPTPPLLSRSNHTLSSASHYSQSHSTLPPSNDDTFIDFPDLNLPGDPSSPAELLTSRPDVANAISRIVSAASQLTVVVRPPFLTICDASMIVRTIYSSVSSYSIGFLSPSITSLPACDSLRHSTSQSSSALLAPLVYLS
jgi:hypothetical protein